jgi:hypothetical protein
MHVKFAKKVSFINMVALVAGIAAPLVLSQQAQAANLTSTSVRLDRMKATTATGGTVCTRPTTVDVETLVKVTFPAGFVVTATPANWTVTTTNLPAGTSAWPGILTATSATGQDVTFPSGDLVIGTTYCFNFSGTNTLTTGAAGNDKSGVVTTQKAGPTTIDSANYATAIVSDDQIVVTAVVPPNFSFALSGNTDTFTANLSSSAVVSTSGRTTTISTNANNGWIAWVKSTNAGLNSLSTGASIATAGVLDNAPTDLAATTGYVLNTAITTDSALGTGTVSQLANFGAEYAGNATSGGTLSNTAFQAIASSNGTTGGDVLTLIERAKVTAVQAAANDYTDTLTVIAAGRF